MMTMTSDLIRQALEQCGIHARSSGPSQWSFALNNGRLLKATARLDDGWLTLEAPAPKTAARSRRKGTTEDELWDLLRWNRKLRVGARFVLRPLSLQPWICADIPLDDVIDAPRRIHEACDALKAALAASDDAGPQGMTSTAVGQTTEDGVDLARLCEEAGWAFTKRSEGRLAADLDVPGDVCQAILEKNEDGGVRAFVELANWPPASDAAQCREAVAVLLLLTSGLVRMACAAIEETPEQVVASLEVRLADPCTAEIAHALSALSVACQMSGREAQALLADGGLASLYLKLLGWSGACRSGRGE